MFPINVSSVGFSELQITGDTFETFLYLFSIYTFFYVYDFYACYCKNLIAKLVLSMLVVF